MPSPLTFTIWWIVGVGGSVFALIVLGCVVRDAIRHHRDCKAADKRLQSVLKTRW